MVGSEGWPTASYDGSRRALAALKNLTSQLIGRFAKAATEATLEAYGHEALLIRFAAEVVVPREIEAEIALLKGAVAGFVMSLPTRQPVYARQRELLTELLDALWASGTAHLEPEFAELFERADDDASRRRVIVDQLASLTDQSALALHANVSGTSLVTA